MHTPQLAGILDRLRTQPSRTGSVIVSLYGDAIAPRGGSLALSSLLAICRGMGLSEGVVRTAISRLAADGWLAANRQGRTGFYRLTEHGRQETAAAAQRIYRDIRPRWSGRLTLCLLPPDEDRAALEAAGFAVFAPGVLLSPDAAAAPAGLTLRAEAEPDVLRRLARQCWPLDKIAEGYQQVLEIFGSLQRHGVGALPPLEALVARVLLIHAFRRAVLKDPLLPGEMLPADWPGFAARSLVASLYAALLPPAEAWLDGHARAEGGPLPKPDAGLAARFRR